MGLPHETQGTPAMTTTRLPALTRSAAMVAAPLTGVVAAVALPALAGDPPTEIAALAAHPTRWYVYAIFMLISSCLLAPAVLGVMALLRDRAPRWSVLAGVLAQVGVLIGIGDAAVELVYWQMGAPGADRAQMVALADRYESALGSSLPFTVGGLAALIGMAALAAALWRTRVAPRWAAVGLLLGTVANVVGFSTSQAVLVGSYVVLLAALTPMALRLAGRRPISSAPRTAAATPAATPR